MSGDYDPGWVKLFSETKVGDIIPKSRRVITIGFAEPVSELLKKLASNNIHCAVVTDPEKPWEAFGFADVMDVLYHVLDSYSWTSTDYQKLKWEAMCFSWKEVYQISNESRKDPFFTVKYDTPISDVLTQFSKGIHRLAVHDAGRIANVVSQIDVLELVASSGTYLGTPLNKPLAEVGLGALGLMKKTWILRDDMKVIDVLRNLKDAGVSGAPVVDKRGIMVCNFSASDLVGLTEENFGWINLPVKEYLNRIHQGKPKPPVTCTVDDKLEFLLLKFSVHKVHRVYLVNENLHPIGVVTLTDLMNFFLPETYQGGINLPKDPLHGTSLMSVENVVQK